ncbi:MAG: hypothetical protein JXR19_02480 [Bacteroidia bacterium]
MRHLISIAFLFVCSLIYAQEEHELQFGDTLYFGACHSEAYTYMDLYVKTRFEKDSISYDSLFEWEFYNRFFNTGDFDVSRMPCSYSGKYGVIKHMMAIETDQGDVINVVVAMILDGKSVAYIVEEAFINEEVLLAPQ